MLKQKLNTYLNHFRRNVLLAPVNDDWIIIKENFDVGKYQIEDPDVINVIKRVKNGTLPNFEEFPIKVKHANITGYGLNAWSI